MTLFGGLVIVVVDDGDVDKDVIDNVGLCVPVRTEANNAGLVSSVRKGSTVG